MSVVVDYRGPSFLRKWIDSFKIQIFDRVNQIVFRYRDVGEIGLSREDVSRLPALERISFSKQLGQIDGNDLEKMKAIVPECRLETVEQDKYRIDVTLKQPSIFGCPQ